MKQIQFGSRTLNVGNTTQDIINVEDALGGTNLLTTLMDIETSKGKIPSTRDSLMILWGASTRNTHGLRKEDIYTLFEEYKAQGGTTISLVEIVFSAIEALGVLGKTEEALTTWEEIPTIPVEKPQAQVAAPQISQLPIQ